jgi:methyl-accepting chemotaxis protein
MKLQYRVLLLYLCIAVLVLVLIGGVLPASLHKQNLEAISGDSINQLKHIDFALSNFIGEAKYDVLDLSLDDNIQTRDDSHFTSFLNASEENFQYSVGDQEQVIVNILKDYQTTHPYVSSVYMGRENGAFVRSYPRARPTVYDPRDRPWYILAKEHPGQVSVTDPYKAVTTDDVNIGIVTPVLDKNGTMIGVVGADITLVNLTSYIATVSSVDGGEMILVDQHGTILAGRDSSLLYNNISRILGDQTPVFLTTKEGVLVLNGTYLIYYTSPELGWKIGTFVPFSTVDQKINDSILRILLFVLLALVLLSVITLIALNYTVIHPLADLTEVSRKIAETGDLDQTIKTGGAGEIGSLARSFKAMVGKIHEEEQGREQALAELAVYRDHLEDIVAERTRELARANNALEEENAQRLAAEAKLRSSLEEKTVLLKEIHHRVKNNLQIVASLLNLQSRYVKDESTLAAIRESQNRVKAMALVHEKLYRSEDLSHIDLNEYISFLGTGLFQFYDAKSQGIRFRLEIHDVNVDINTAIPLGLIINELISNSLKYAFPNGRSGEVSISIKKEDHTLTVQFHDDGVGIPENQDWRNTRSLGLQLVNSLTDQMDGTIELDRSAGTRFTLVLHEKEQQGSS